MNLNEYASCDAIGLARLVANSEVTSAELADLAIKPCSGSTHRSTRSSNTGRPP